MFCSSWPCLYQWFASLRGHRAFCYQKCQEKLLSGVMLCFWRDWGAGWGFFGVGGTEGGSQFGVFFESFLCIQCNSCAVELKLNLPQTQRNPRSKWLFLFGLGLFGREVLGMWSGLSMWRTQSCSCVSEIPSETPVDVLLPKALVVFLLPAQGWAITCGKDANLISKVCGVATSSI